MAFNFLSIDALSSASGTTINYIDTTTGVDVSGYGNVIGAMPLFHPTSNGTLLLAKGVYRSGTSTSMQFYSMTVNGTYISINAQKLAIRVFYF